MHVVFALALLAGSIAPANSTEPHYKLVTQLPAGSLNEHAGFFNLEIRSGVNYLTKIGLALGGKTYNCVQLQFRAIDAVPDNDYTTIK